MLTSSKHSIVLDEIVDAAEKNPKFSYACVAKEIVIRRRFQAHRGADKWIGPSALVT